MSDRSNDEQGRLDRLNDIGRFSHRAAAILLTLHSRPQPKTPDLSELRAQYDEVVAEIKRLVAEL